MEPRRAMFLRAHNHNLEKDGLPRGFRAALGGFLVSFVEVGTSVFFKMTGGKKKHIELTEESGRNRPRDICRRW